MLIDTINLLIYYFNSLSSIILLKILNTICFSYYYITHIFVGKSYNLTNSLVKSPLSKYIIASNNYKITLFI